MHKRLALAAVAAVLAVGAAVAQTAPATSPQSELVASGSKEAKGASAVAKSPRSAASVECSRRADAKNLHGKARKSFRRNCLKTAKKEA